MKEESTTKSKYACVYDSPLSIFNLFFYCVRLVNDPLGIKVIIYWDSGT